MANDISYFKVQGDDTQYSFNDADLDSRIGAEEMGTEAQTITGAVAELAGEVGENTSDIETNKAAIGTLSSLTTGAKGSLVAAINEVDAHADTNASNIATNASNIATNTSNIATNTSNIATNTSNIATNASAISQLNSKMTVSQISNIAFSTGVTNTEARVCKMGNIVSGHIIFRVSEDLNQNGAEIVTSGLPPFAAGTLLQVVCTCVGGSGFGTTVRLAISTEGKLTTYWSATTLASGSTWICTLAYLCA